MVECLPHRHKAKDLIPSIAQNWVMLHAYNPNMWRICIEFEVSIGHETLSQKKRRKYN